MNALALAVALWLLSGALVEAFNSVIRHWSVSQLGLGAGYGSSAARVASGRWWSATLFAAGFAVRLAVASLTMVFAFRQSVASGFAALVGYWICRWVMVWWVARRLSRRKPSSGQ